MDKSFGGEKADRVERYVMDVFSPEDAVLAEIRERSKREGLPQIHVGAMDGLHLEVLARAIGARRAVEIGTLAGYSGVRIARGLAPGGRLWTLDADSKHARVARESFDRAGVSDRVEVRVGPAIEQLQGIVQDGPFDFIFVDADKAGYPAYADWAATHLRIGGILIGDNTLGWGMIADSDIADDDDRLAIEGLRRFNAQVAQGGRFMATLLPTGEGLTIAVKIR